MQTTLINLRKKVSIEFFAFMVLGILALASAILTITAHHPIVSAMSLVFHFFMLSGIYLTLSAQFIAVMQVLVYAGAIMVLVVFVLMLLNMGKNDRPNQAMNFRKIIGWFLGLAFAVQIIVLVTNGNLANSVLPQSATEIGKAQSIGEELFKNYIYPLQAVALLLFSAIVGAIVLAKRKIIE